MTGNDVVDILQARKESNWQRPGFLEKLFTTDERQLIFSATDAERMVWLLWSMKEAAYKIYNRQTGQRGFFPKDIVCRDVIFCDNGFEGVVECRGEKYFTRSTIDSEILHTVAAVRKTALTTIAEVEACAVHKDENGLPYITGDANNRIPVSVSHHGRAVKIVKPSLMNYKIIFVLILSLFASVKSFAQKEYIFDYVMDYAYSNDTMKVPKHYYRFVNSQDNSYILSASEDGKDNLTLNLYDDGMVYISSITKESFSEVEAISIKCPLALKHQPLKRRKVFKDYTFKKLNDTIINSEVLQHYIFFPLDSKKAKRKDWRTVHYIFKRDSVFSTPVLNPDGIADIFWKNNKSLIPGGFYKECYIAGADGTQTTDERLMQCVPLKKIIFIDDNCK